MYRKMGIKLTTKYSPNFGLPKRLKKRIKFIIIHYTGMKKETAAIERLLSPKSKVSSHYYIKKKCFRSSRTSYSKNFKWHGF